MSALLSCRVFLPATFRPDDILAFHRRDGQESAERVNGWSLEKALLRADAPACLSIRFGPGEARAELALDGDPTSDCGSAFNAMVGRMLGLSQDVEAFERRHRDHPELGRLIAAQSGLRVPVAATPFEALTWAITGQQISVAAAVSLRRRLIHTVGRRHSGGLLCYPGPRQIAALSFEDIRRAGFSTSKANTLLALARLIVDERLPLDAWLSTVPVEEIREGLLAVRGVGPWTVDYTLLRGFGWLDGSLHGDVAVRRGLQSLLGRSDKVSESDARTWLAGFSPWRALTAAHLWAKQSTTAY
jgi:DNA-3-methyladenine glycosylase II